MAVRAIKLHGRKGERSMRIEAYNQVNQIYQQQKINKTDKSGKVGRTDQVQISSFGKDIQALKSAVAESPDIRSELAEPLKQQIQNGTYDVSNEDFASKLLEKYDAWR